MGICYSSKSVYVVRFFDCTEKNQLLNTVETFGIGVPEKYRQGDYSLPGDTCTFAVDLRHRRIEYLAQPFICAAMASSGVRFYSVREFCRLAERGFPRNTRTPVFHVPHDGSEFPPELMASICVPQAQFLRYHEKMRDTGNQTAAEQYGHIGVKGMRQHSFSFFCKKVLYKIKTSCYNSKVNPTPGRNTVHFLHGCFS